MRNFTELVVSLMVVLLVGFSLWKSATNKFNLTQAMAEAQAAEKANEAQKPTLMDDLRQARQEAKKTIQAGFGGALPANRK